MTPTRFSRFLFIGWIALGFLAQPSLAGDKKGKNGKKPQSPRPEWVSEVIRGEDDSPDVAESLAFINARKALEQYLLTQRPLVKTPDDDYIRDHLLIEQPKLSADPNEIKSDKKYAVTLKVGVDADKFAAIFNHQRDERSRDRMMGLGRMLAIVVAFLATVSGYLRVEEATKGYYTTWLRVGAIGFVGAVGAGMWLIS
jgi:hypothetical protein